ncbi:Glucose-6-phosphate isomerase-Phosphoglucose isomerase-Phosphohexose isomerase [Moritella viscosa]|uniref:Glucose-6-phosphate isomerase-Phosphoglucose isomerase-Phosphohexose isomerase n=2 Tax=Moritella viscosa TaxID=80854 RepID=A0ABY1HMQ5_9GAMM|nr:Glucose-6-phosphate isomerase-Phosphoglucose isomerase-Phosphohexose isomerase [Moritella viscosa]SGZ16652.1 Glucose-6-phosphate isomerase-Phosphoglucose isomerase-Phosphohexose isomerase [Moritella viscosa]SHO28253.1 Glucose-6-phosphate isomerase-Phosphoglucose isomerase-Phosphohexose isomerase [Moritella viscosa]
MSYGSSKKILKDGSIREYPQILLTIRLGGKTKKFRKLYTIHSDSFGHCRTTREQAIKKLTILGNSYADSIELVHFV